ncbi:MAG: small multi-drug export protein [Lachnospiraceae bacterium]|nr:small multi-drug export protein [Lachnospiraceae bacterium]
MDALVEFFTATLGQYVSAEVVVFLISMVPILELRGGLLAASLLQIPITKAIPICIIGNIIPIPFILLFIKAIFKWMKNHNILKGVVERIEEHAMKRSGQVSNAEFIGLMLFVGIPLPGTGAWTGSLIASLLDVDFKKAVIAELCGIAIATVIMSIVSYGLLGSVIR